MSSASTPSTNSSGFTPHPGDERLTTAILSDSCDESGLRNQVLNQRLAPITPGSRAIGRARTVRFAPALESDLDDPYKESIDFIDGIAAGQMIVIATAENNDSGFWGELFSAAAMGAKASGVITDGNLRDTVKIAALGFPAFSRSRPEQPTNRRSWQNCSPATRCAPCGNDTEFSKLATREGTTPWFFQ